MCDTVLLLFLLLLLCIEFPPVLLLASVSRLRCNSRVLLRSASACFLFVLVFLCRRDGSVFTVFDLLLPVILL